MINNELKTVVNEPIYDGIIYLIWF